MSHAPAASVVAPRVTPPPRLTALAKLPIFLDLQGRRVVVAGGGEPVVWKVELLAAAGAKLAVYASAVDPALEAFVAGSDGQVTLHRRPWREADLAGAWLAVADVEAEEAERFAAAARRQGVLANVIDKPDHCDFQFGAIVNRSPVVVGISTDGAAPILAQAIRRRIEAVLPPALGSWSRTAKGFRERLKEILPAKAERRRFWEKFVDVSFISQADEDEQLAAIERLAHETLAESGRRRSRTGEVVIVGAGPGDPEALTLAAVRELQAADVIVYDRLVTPGTLELARREARRVLVGKEGHGAACRQEDICALIVDLALAGERVVRLKGGDPAIFGRTGEEVEACRDAGVPVRIVPGVTTASAAAAWLGLSLTHRDHAQRVQFVTGHDRHGGLPADLDLDALADPRATTVIYMGRRTAAGLAQALLARDLPGDTPVIVASDVSRPGAARIATTLRGLAEGAALAAEGPTLVAIGAALNVEATAPAETASAVTV